MEVAILINTGRRDFSYSRGPLGVFRVPAASGKEFGMLVIYPRGEIQDIGNGRSMRNETVKAADIAKDIMGETGRNHGVFVCAAAPDVPRSLEKAEEEEHDFLARHPGRIQFIENQARKMRELRTVYDGDDKKDAEKFSARVANERKKFEDACRKLVEDSEVQQARHNREEYCKFLCGQADAFYDSEAQRKEIGPHHTEAAREIGYEAEWCKTLSVSEDCPGCGTKVKVGVAICKACGAVLNDKAARELRIGPYAPHLVAKAS